MPWYVNETLAGREEELVRKHLAGCRECQKERDRLYELGQLVKDDVQAVDDVQGSFNRAWQRIEMAEKNRDSVLEIERASGPSKRWIPFSLAAGILLLAGLQGLQKSEMTPVSDYQTLTSGESVPGGLRRMELGFEQPIPAVTLRQALVETGSNIVSGPDANGVYIVEVRLAEDEDDLGYLDRLQQIEGVRHARFTAD